MRELFKKQLNCDQAKKLLDGALDGELSPKQERELSAHLDSCKHCKNELEMRRQMQFAMKADAPIVPPALHDSVMRRIHTEKQEFLPRIPRPAFTLAGALCVVALVVGVMLSPNFGAVMKDAIGIEDAMANAAPEASTPSDFMTEDEAKTDKDTSESLDVQVYTLQNSSVTVTLTMDSIAHVTDENGMRLEGQYKQDGSALTIWLKDNQARFTILADGSLVLVEGSLLD